MGATCIQPVSDILGTANDPILVRTTVNDSLRGGNDFKIRDGLVTVVRPPINVVDDFDTAVSRDLIRELASQLEE
jgi:hypothetical protein